MFDSKVHYMHLLYYRKLSYESTSSDIFYCCCFLEQVVGVIKYNTIAKVLSAGDEELRQVP